MNNSIKNSSDFLFIYEAIQCNPNGDPDQENKPRMDYDTGTNLVTDTRLKRFLRDYLKNNGHEIFVDFVEDRKVNMAQRIEGIVKSILKSNSETIKNIIDDENLSNLLIELLKAIHEKADSTKKDFDEIVWSVLTISSKKEKDELKKDKFLKKFEAEFNNIRKINLKILSYIVTNKFLDIRLFGSAFAIAGFNQPYTGPVQINWGYSFNKVELIDSDSIVTIMNDDSSTFGKDYRVHYSLLGFNGTINANMAKITGLTEPDVKIFRDAIWKAIPANPTRSKLNQYPKLYLEVIYNEGISNGQFGDLRNFVKVRPVDGKEEKQVRKFSDLTFDIQNLLNLVNENKGEGKMIKNIVLRTSADLNISL